MMRSEPVPLVFGGPVAPLTSDGRLSAIHKTPLPSPWVVGREGLVGDAQADRQSHGGLEKALHHYPYDHYALWRAEIGAHPLLDTRGAFGENLSTTGWTETDVHIGDVVEIGRVRLQVSHGRQPCWKLNARFGRRTMARDVQTTGRTGWYYRVLAPGVIEPGQAMRLVERPCPDWPLSRLIDVLYRKTRDRAALAAMADMPLLAEDWRVIARRRLASGQTEDWGRRLEGPGVESA